MAKILFYATNGMSLGHLRRVALIARRIKTWRSLTEIILATSSNRPAIFGRFYDQLVRLMPLSDEMVKDPCEHVRRTNAKKLANAFIKFKPDLVAADFYLPSDFTFYPLKYARQYFPAPSYLIWRLGGARTIRNILSEQADKLALFKRVFIPHEKKEIEHLGLDKLRGPEKGRFRVCGPVFRKLEQAGIEKCRRKYGLKPHERLVTISFGGGGELKLAKCESPRTIYRHCLRIWPRLKRIWPDLKLIIVTGPHFSKPALRKGDLRVVRFEKYLPELFSLSRLVVCSAGYNTCQDILSARTPALFTPLMRKDREQFDRARMLAGKGVAKVWTGGGEESLLRAVRNSLMGAAERRKYFSRIKHADNGLHIIVRSILNETAK